MIVFCDGPRFPELITKIYNIGIVFDVQGVKNGEKRGKMGDYVR
jgi:hypothetical protein